MRSKCRPRSKAIGVGPENKNLIGCPNRSSGSKSPDDIVDVLTAEHETLALIAGRPFGVKFEARALPSQHVKTQFKSAIKQKNRNRIQRQEIQNPARRQSLHRLNAWQEPGPERQSRQHEQDVPR